jgi:hypothetical protein
MQCNKTPNVSDTADYQQENYENIMHIDFYTIQNLQNFIC